MDNGNQNQPVVPEPAPLPPVQPSAPMQAMPQPAPMPAPGMGVQPQAMSAQQIQDSMKKQILKIIAILTVISLAVVTLVFFLSSSSDGSLTTTSERTNAQASYDVPTAWFEDTAGTLTVYTNTESLATAQATMLVRDPARISLTDGGVSEKEAQSIASDYRREVASDSTNLEVTDPEIVQVEGFEFVYEMELGGLADDGVTEVQGQSRLYFDAEGYVHVVEFLSVRAYWSANTTEILDILNSYQLKDD